MIDRYLFRGKRLDNGEWDDTINGFVGRLGNAVTMKWRDGYR